MISSESQGFMNYFISSSSSNNPHENHLNFPTIFGLNSNNNMPSFEFTRSFLTTTPPNPLNVQDYAPIGSCISNNSSTSDEADDHHEVGIIDERKKRRMISNRESARRSRMRKQRHLDELWSQVLRLRTENHSLVNKLNHVSESHDRVLEENARLKEEALDLRQMLTDIQISNSYTTFLRDFEQDDIPCNTAHLKAESSTQSVTTNLLH